MLLQRKPVELTAWHLSDQSDMVAALTALQEQGWRGGISYSNAWRLELNSDSDDQIIATIGDWLILDMGLRKMSTAECSANYDEVAE